MASLSDHQYDFYRLKVSEETKADFGSVAAAADNVVVAEIVNPGASGGRGWYEIYGHGYSNVANGLRLDVGGTTKVEFAMPANTLVYFGPYLVQISDDTADITVETNGASNTASATLYAKRVGD